MKRVAQIACTVCLLFLSVSPARADPVVVGAGSGFFVTDFLARDGSFDNFGTFVLPDRTTGLFGREVFSAARMGCNPCAPGDVVNLSSSHELRGPTYLSAGTPYSVWGTGTLDFRAGDVVIPHSSDVSVGLGLIVPFEFDGVISLFGEPGGVPLFSGAVTGSGYTRAFFWGSDASRTFRQQEYRFGQDPFTPAPVPEPSTLIMGGAGLLALVRAARRR